MHVWIKEKQDQFEDTGENSTSSICVCMMVHLKRITHLALVTSQQQSSYHRVLPTVPGQLEGGQTSNQFSKQKGRNGKNNMRTERRHAEDKWHKKWGSGSTLKDEEKEKKGKVAEVRRKRRWGGEGGTETCIFYSFHCFLFFPSSPISTPTLKKKPHWSTGPISSQQMTTWNFPNVGGREKASQGWRE